MLTTGTGGRNGSDLEVSPFLQLREKKKGNTKKRTGL
jgi:hypothetical protein